MSMPRIPPAIAVIGVVGFISSITFVSAAKPALKDFGVAKDFIFSSVTKSSVRATREFVPPISNTK